MLALIGPAEILILLLGVPFVFGLFALWAMSLIHCIRNTSIPDTNRIIWAVVICLTHVIGAVLYLLFGRSSGSGSGTATAAVR